jgi:SAM-dependent methyltransferase
VTDPSAWPDPAVAGARAPRQALLGDTASRDYSHKLALFNAFAAPELRRAIRHLALCPGMRALDVGCGTGAALRWLQEAVGPRGSVTGIDLSAAHVLKAREVAPPGVAVRQGDFMSEPLAPASIDLAWCVNTINHLREPQAGLERLAHLLRPGGRIALGQSSLLPDLHFAWDSRLERLTHEAVRRYYEDKYGLEEDDLRGARNLLGWMRRAGLRHIRINTTVIERIAPLAAADEAYLLEAIYQGTWAERLRAYLPPADFAELERLCDPRLPCFALHREDFHFIQTFTVVVGEAP